MWDGFNKRKFPRVSVKCDLLIESAGKNAPVSTSTQNLGVGGACVVIDRAMSRFDRCRIRLFLGSKKDKIECEGKVVWSIPTKDAKSRKACYDTGIEFEALSEDQLKAIETYLSKQQEE